MGDSKLNTLWITVIRPLSGVLIASVIQSFFLSFTDFGIPASVGGKFEVISSFLYNQMLGNVLNFNNGAVIAMIMLIPSVIAIILLYIIEKYNIHYSKISDIEIKKDVKRDLLCTILSTFICILSVFAVIFIIPFTKEWPYEIGFTLKIIKSVFADHTLINIFKNSLCKFFNCIIRNHFYIWCRISNSKKQHKL